MFSWRVSKTWADGGEDPMERVAAYACDDGEPHWHYVSSGMADPEKIEVDSDSTGSGCGYELTFRLRRNPDENEAPVWPVVRMQEIGWGILTTNMKLGHGHYLRRRTVITGGAPETELLGCYLIRDPELSETTCESGSFNN